MWKCPQPELLTGHLIQCSATAVNNATQSQNATSPSVRRMDKMLQGHSDVQADQRMNKNLASPLVTGENDVDAAAELHVLSSCLKTDEYHTKPSTLDEDDPGLEPSSDPVSVRLDDERMRFLSSLPFAL